MGDRKVSGRGLRRDASPRLSVFWWSDEIAEIRKACIAALRAYQRDGRRWWPREHLKETFKSAKLLLRLTIRKAQEAAWRRLVDTVEADPWGRAYKIVTRKIGGSPPGAESAGREMTIVDGLFPSRIPPDWSTLPLWTNVECELAPFTLEESASAVTRLSAGKDPGPDGVVNEVLTAVARLNPAPLLRTLNACLKNATFLSDWNRARIILLHKGPSKPVTVPSSFRPISLLDGMGKLLERMLLNRLASVIAGALAPNQFGF